jgi:hypothetical protein
MSERKCPNPLCSGAQELVNLSKKTGVLTRTFRCARCKTTSIARGSLPDATENTTP